VLLFRAALQGPIGEERRKERERVVSWVVVSVKICWCQGKATKGRREEEKKCRAGKEGRVVMCGGGSSVGGLVSMQEVETAW
jgi:hypothetical protein